MDGLNLQQICQILSFHDKKLLFHYKNDEKAENSVLIKIDLIYRGSAYGSNRRKNCGEVYTKRTH